MLEILSLGNIRYVPAFERDCEFTRVRACLR
jgi:hypothetical protein